MKKFNYSFFIALALLTLAFGGTTADAQRKQKVRMVPVTYGMISVKTSPESYPVFVDGRQIMSSGVEKANEEQLAPGTYNVEIRFPNKSWTNERFEVRAGKRSCVCLSYKETTPHPCPSDVQVTVTSGERVNDGDLVTFSSNVNYSNTDSLRYKWTVTPESAPFTGQGTPSITVDTTDLKNQTVTGRLEVVDQNYDDPNCRGENFASIPIKEVIIEDEKRKVFDRFKMIAFDDVKARLDNYAIELQSLPDWGGYIVVYGRTAKEADRLGARAMDYLTRNRKIDGRRLTVVNWGVQKNPSYELWLIPANGTPPPPPSN